MTTTTSPAAPVHPRGQFRPRGRKIVLTAHVATAVGWLGAAYCMAVLGTVGLLSDDRALALGSYKLMQVFDLAVNAPLSLSMLATGLLSSLGTKWGLIRHRWVLTKFVISTLLTVFTPVLSVPRVSELIDRLTTGTPPGTLPVQVVAISLVVIAILTAITAVSIFKPWGRTRWARQAGTKRG